MRRIAMTVLFAAFAVSAIHAKVTTDSDPTVSFMAFKTYYWAAKPEGGSPLLQQRIVDGIDTRLQAKGWTMAEDGDVAIAAHISKSQQQTIDTFYTGTPMGGWGWRGFGGMGSATTTVRTYDEGTLVIDMFDAQTKKAIWRGTISATLPSSPEKLNKKLDKELNKLFAKFPPGSTAK